MTPQAPPAPPPRTPPGAAIKTTQQPKAVTEWISNGTAQQQPPRIIINAVEGFGKTTAGAYADNPAILMAQGETGYETLLAAGLVPQVDRVLVTSWDSLLAIVNRFIAEDTGHKTLVLDAIGGFERLCHQLVCDRDFGGDWGERGFASYQKGYDLAIGEWLKLLAALDQLRDKRGTAIVLLSHCKVKTFKNPLGADYDRWTSDVHDKTWSVTAKWSDAVFFGNFFTIVEGGKTGDKPRKGKGTGGTQRVIYAQRRDAFDAKNRYGIGESFDLPSDPSAMWTTIYNQITGKAAQ